MLTDMRRESCHLNAHGHFALTDTEQAPGVQAAESSRPVATTAPPAGRELVPYRTDPKGFRVGNTRHRAGLGRARGGAQVSALTLGPRHRPSALPQALPGPLPKGMQADSNQEKRPWDTPPVGNTREAGPLPATVGASPLHVSNLRAVFRHLILKCEWTAMSG